MFSFIIVFLCTSSCVVRVVVHRLIVHDELVADEVEGVGAVAVGAVFELGNLLRAAFRDGVNRLPAVCAVGDAEAELEVVASYQLILEIVALDHAEVINLLRAHAKHQRRAHRLTVPALYFILQGLLLESTRKARARVRGKGERSVGKKVGDLCRELTTDERKKSLTKTNPANPEEAAMT